MKQTTIRTNDSAGLAAAIDELRREIARLSERTAALEKALTPAGRQPVEKPAAMAKPTTVKSDAIDEATIMVISAAIAAYFGCKPNIRQIVLVQSHPWSEQGRVTIQASHSLSIHHG